MLFGKRKSTMTHVAIFTQYKKNLIPYRDLLWQLTLRELKGKYKQSVLGYAWVLLVPLINLVVLSLVFSHLFKVPTGHVPYPLYLFVGLVPWTFLSNAISLATVSLVANSSLITKIYLPREIFPLSSVIAKIIDFLLTAVVLVLFIIYYKSGFYWTLAYVPLIFFVQFILVTGVGLILSAMNVFYRDVEHLLGVFLLMWMYLTPIIYSPELIPKNLRPWFSLNPMTGIINAYRNTVLYGVSPAWTSFLFSAIISIAIFIIGYAFFIRRSKYFADSI